MLPGYDCQVSATCQGVAWQEELVLRETLTWWPAAYSFGSAGRWGPCAAGSNTQKQLWLETQFRKCTQSPELSERLLLKI